MNLKAAKSELRAAMRSIEIMKSTPDFEMFEEEWRDFLNCIEQFWNKVERSCQHEKNTFEPWQGKYKRLRKKDMLLRYLKQARHAHSHSIQEISEIKPASREINFLKVKNFHMRDGKVSYQGEPPEIIDRPKRIAVVRVENNGSWYNPPTCHLGERFNSDCALDIAIAGFEFYKNYIEQVEEKFFNDCSS